ncbi:MAG TPA: glycosyltransferase [Moraxellaceae bacterium]
MSPLVSVIMPAYNHERYVEQSIRSVIAQDYENIELVILNDGSRDGTDAVIRALAPECERRFRRFEYISKANEGVAITMNRGIDWCRGDFISSISSDDAMKPEKVSVLLAALQAAGEAAVLSYGDADFMDDRGIPVAIDATGAIAAGPSAFTSFIALHLRDRDDVRLGENSFDYEVLLRENFLPGMAMMWRKEALEAVGCFTPGIAIEDWDLWLRLARRYRGVYVPAVVATYRWHDSNTIKVASVKLLEGQDFILRRELAHVWTNPRLRKLVARKICYVARELCRRGRWSYMSRWFNPWIVLPAYLPAKM